jgi:hypothetical protein
VLLAAGLTIHDVHPRGNTKRKRIHEIASNNTHKRKQEEEKEPWDL